MKFNPEPTKENLLKSLNKLLNLTNRITNYKYCFRYNETVHNLKYELDNVIKWYSSKRYIPEEHIKHKLKDFELVYNIFKTKREEAINAYSFVNGEVMRFICLSFLVRDTRIQDNINHKYLVTSNIEPIILLTLLTCIYKIDIDREKYIEKFDIDFVLLYNNILNHYRKYSSFNLSYIINNNINNLYSYKDFNVEIIDKKIKEFIIE